MSCLQVSAVRRGLGSWLLRAGSQAFLSSLPEANRNHSQVASFQEAARLLSERLSSRSFRLQVETIQLSTRRILQKRSTCKVQLVTSPTSPRWLDASSAAEVNQVPAD